MKDVLNIIPSCRYTSLGSRKNTSKNPELRYTDAMGSDLYYPAYFLKDSSVERDGRSWLIFKVALASLWHRRYSNWVDVNIFFSILQNSWIEQKIYQYI